MEMNQADLAESYAAIRAWLPTDEWEGMFTPKALAAFAPKRGSEGIQPTLDILARMPDATRHRRMVVLDDSRWNQWEGRTAMLTQLGSLLATQRGTVVALRLASEAWLKQMTDAEARERAHTNRAVSSYPDKREIVMVFGATIDGRMAAAFADLQRDRRERITTVGSWNVSFTETGEQHAHHMTLLNFFWRSYHQGYLARQIHLEDDV